MIYLKLMISFMKIGLFSFGGGYAMIPLIQREIESNGWLSHKEFLDIIAVSQITPGPIAVNSATFVGYKVAGFLGAVVSTIGVSLPTFVLVVFLSKILKELAQSSILESLLYGIRPLVLSLITLTVVYISREILINKTNFLGIEWKSLLMIILSFLVIKKFKISPVVLIICAGVIGIIIY